MKYLTLLLMGISLFFHAACGENPRLNSSPTPIITSIEVIDSQQLPKERIDYTTLNEIWAKILIKGSNFNDQYDTIDTVRLRNGDKSVPGVIGEVTNNQIKLTLDLWDYSFGGPGTYMVSVKTKLSEWSNSMPVVIY